MVYSSCRDNPFTRQHPLTVPAHLGGLVSSLARPPLWWHVDIFWLACAIQGEGAHLFPHRDEVGIAIAHVVLNRVDDLYFPATIPDVVQGGFWGALTITQPDEWAISLAQRALELPDTTHGSLFVFSGDDIRHLNLSPALSERSIYNGRWELHFYKELPPRSRESTTSLG